LGRPSKIWIYKTAREGKGVTELFASNSEDEFHRPLSLVDEQSPGDEEQAHGDLTGQQIESMAESRAPEDLDTLATVVAEHPDVEMRYLAIALLGDIPDDRAVLAIERGLADPDPLFRSHVVATLGISEAPEAVRSLGFVIFGESDPNLRLLAVHNLAIREEEPARAFLTDAARDPDPAVRRAAAKALRAIR
jgi:HEAT repeat protein